MLLMIALLLLQSSSFNTLIYCSVPESLQMHRIKDIKWRHWNEPGFISKSVQIELVFWHDYLRYNTFFLFYFAYNILVQRAVHLHIQSLLQTDLGGKKQHFPLVCFTDSRPNWTSVSFWIWMNYCEKKALFRHIGLYYLICFFLTNAHCFEQVFLNVTNIPKELPKASSAQLNFKG